MLSFYKKAALLTAGLIILSLAAAYLAFDRTFLELPLLPQDESGLPWHALTETDNHFEGQSTIKLLDERFSLDVEMNVSDVVETPYASVSLLFHDENGERRLVDLTRFSGMTFNVKCSPANILNFTLYTVDDTITKPDEYVTYRGPITFFSCDEQWRRISLDLTRLEVPRWWIDMFDLKISMRDYRRDQVPRLLFASSYQSPMNQPTRIQITSLQLTGRDWRYVYLLVGTLLLMWGLAGIWLFRQHTRALIHDLRDKIQQDRPLVAYQQISVEPRRDKDKGTILHYMATEYANPELTLDTMVSAVGISRTKINDILKAELGFTFSGYLNKIRLTEAARLLVEVSGTNVAEIAYSVGYKNVSYFNKLFKDEYGCTPKAFKGIYDKASLHSK